MVEAFAGALAALVGEAGEIGVFVLGMAVQRAEQQIAATIEDLLRAVAVVEIDVEDRDACSAAVDERLGRDGGVVEEAVAAVEVVAGMVTGRTAEREGGALAGGDQRAGR